MRSKATLWLLCAVLLAALPMAPLCGQSLDEIVKKSIEVRGGKDKILAVTSLRMTGRMTMGDSDLQGPFSWEWKRPGSFRLDITLQGKDGVQAFDGEKAWIHMPFAGQPEPRILSEDMTRAMASEGDFDGHLLDHKDKGHQLTLLPEGEVDGKKAHRILVTLDTGNLFLYYLDQETYQVVQTESRVFLGEAQIESVSSYSDYRDVNGLSFPHTLEARLKTQPEGRKMTIEKIEIDPEIEDSRFAFPGGESDL